MRLFVSIVPVTLLARVGTLSRCALPRTNLSSNDIATSVPTLTSSMSVSAQKFCCISRILWMLCERCVAHDARFSAEDQVSRRRA
jgi:hypothetical protein